MSNFLETLDIDKLDEYQTSKRNWLMDSNYSQNTIEGYWRLLENNNINLLEKAKAKDLYLFTKPEILEAINYTPTVHISVKSTLLSTISSYIAWACKRGFNYTGNPCDSILMEDISINMVAFKMSYTNLEDFHKFVKGLPCSAIDKMIFLLLRYGVKIKDLPNVKWEDIDRYNKVLDIRYENSAEVLELPIDDRFIRYVDKAKMCETYIYKADDNEANEVEGGKSKKDSTTHYLDRGYILKIKSNQSESAGEVMNLNSIRNRVLIVSDRKLIKRPQVIDYNKARRYDLLFDRLNKYGTIIYQDVKDVVDIFEEKVTDQKTTALKKNFEMISGVTVVTKKNQYKLKQD